MSKKWVLSKLWNLHSKKYYAVFENYIVENYLKLWKNVHNILSMKKIQNSIHSVIQIYF